MNYDPDLEDKVVNDGEATICPELEVRWYALRHFLGRLETTLPLLL